jgi:hypothetical protein
VAFRRDLLSPSTVSKSKIHIACFSYSVCSSVLKMEAIISSKTSANFYKSILCHTPKYSTLLISYLLFGYLREIHHPQNKAYHGGGGGVAFSLTLTFTEGRKAVVK